MDRVSFTVPGDPVGKGRPIMSRRNGQLRAVTPPATVAYEAEVRRCAILAMRGVAPFAGACAVEIAAYMPIPKSWGLGKARKAAAGHVLPIGKPDADNIVKAALDPLGAKPKRGKRLAEPGAVWRDDTQAVEVRVVKRYSDRPRLEVSVVHLEAAERGVVIVPKEEAGRAAA